MSFTYNRVTLLGRAAAAPESRVTAGGQRLATFSVATDRPARVGATPTTDWHRVLCWDRLAEIAVEHVTRGRLVFVEGTIAYRSWEDKDRDRLSHALNRAEDQVSASDRPYRRRCAETSTSR